MNSLFRGVFICLLIFVLPLYAQEGDRPQIVSTPGDDFGNVSFDFKNADLKNVLRIFATKANVNIIAGPDVKGSVTMRLRNVPWKKALGVILDVNGFGFQRDGNIIKVLSLTEMAQQPTQTRVYFLNYAEGKRLEKSISQLLSKEGTVRTDARSNTLIVTDLPQNLDKITPVIGRLDQQTPQVLVQSMVIETNAVVSEDIGINWAFLDGYGISITGISATYSDTASTTRTRTSTKILNTSVSTTRTFSSLRTQSSVAPDASLVFNNEQGADIFGDSLLVTDTFLRLPNRQLVSTATLTADKLEIFLSFLENTTDSKILSAPEVLTTNNRTARILVGEQYPLANYVFNDDTGTLEVQGFNYIDIGIKLYVTPKISPDGYVTLDVKPEIKTRGANVPFAGATGTLVPIINTQEVEVQAVVKDRETLVIGGLITDDTIESIIKVPFLGDLPFIGARLFTDKSITKNRRNLFVFITPTIVTSKNANDVVEVRRRILDGASSGFPGKRDSFWSSFDPSGDERDLDLELDSVYTGHMGQGTGVTN